MHNINVEQNVNLWIIRRTDRMSKHFIAKISRHRDRREKYSWFYALDESCSSRSYQMCENIAVCWSVPFHIFSEFLSSWKKNERFRKTNNRKLFTGANPTMRDHGRGLRAEQWARYCGRYVCADIIERFARHKLLEKNISCRWGSEPELATKVLQGKVNNLSIAFINPSISHSPINPPHHTFLLTCHWLDIWIRRFLPSRISPWNLEIQYSTFGTFWKNLVKFSEMQWVADQNLNTKLKK